MKFRVSSLTRPSRCHPWETQHMNGSHEKWFLDAYHYPTLRQKGHVPKNDCGVCIAPLSIAQATQVCSKTLH